MKFENIKNESDIETFFLERKFKRIDEPDLFNTDLKDFQHFFFEMDEDGDNFGVFVTPKDFNLSLIKIELLKTFSNHYQFVFYDSFTEFVFIQEISGTDKVITVRKKQREINQIFLDKLNNVEFDNIDSFDIIFDRSELIKEFYDFYVITERYLSINIKGFPESDVRNKYAQITLNRLLFLWFLQVKGFLNDDQSYLISNFKADRSKNYFKGFLRPLFFEGLCRNPNEREERINQLLGEIPYLNGGLFLPTEDEQKFGDSIIIPDDVFYKPMVYPLSNEITELPVLNLLESKPWTVDENSGNVDELNPDILGFIFEKSINQKALGAVYTPEAITARMCKNVLLEYINEEITRKYSISSNFEKFEHLLGIEDNNIRKKIEEKLNKIKIIDPACGSGHYLLKMLFQLEKIYLSVNPNLKKYEIRENIVLNSIFGVDISPEAVEITKLRLFLALAEVYEKAEEIQPLPNIDFNLRSGNSVLGFFEKKVGNLSDHFKDSIASLIRDRNKLIREYEKSSSFEAINKRKSLIEKTNVLKMIFTEKLIQKLKYKSKTVKEFNKEFNPFHWTMEFSEVFSSLNGGFDIIIGNPPYIKADSQEEYYRSYRKLTENLFSLLYERWDLYLAFIELSFYLAKPGGIISLIISDSFNTAKYSTKVRKVMINKKLTTLEFYPGVKIFQTVSVSNIIISIINSKISKNFKTKRAIYDSVTKIKRVEYFDLETTKDNIFRLIDTSGILFLKDLKNCIELGEICYVTYGMALNSDEKRYPGLFGKNDLITEEKDDIPRVTYLENKYLKRFGIEKIQYLEYGTERVPSKVRRQTFKELYTNHKVMVGKMGLRAIYDENSLYCNDSIEVVVPWHVLKNIKNKVLARKKYRKLVETGALISPEYDLRYILAIINSKHNVDFINAIKRHRMKNYAYPDDLKKIPIFKASKEQQKILVMQVKKMENLQNKVTNKSDDESKIEILKELFKKEYNKLNALVENLYKNN